MPVFLKAGKMAAFIVLVGGPLWVAQWLVQSLGPAAYWLFGGFVVLVLAATIPKRCGVCKSPLKRKVRTFKIGNRPTRVCANCARGLDRRASARALAQLPS
jgi:hypothetical protein